MIGVRPIQNSSPFYALEGAEGPKNILQRAWSAVADFFLYIAAKIKAGIGVVWDKCCTRPAGREAVVQSPQEDRSDRMSDALIAKLAPYKTMLNNDLAFVKTAVVNIRRVLERTDQRLRIELQQKLGVDEAGLNPLLELTEDQFMTQMRERNIALLPDQLPNQRAKFDHAIMFGLRFGAYPLYERVMEASVRGYIFAENGYVPTFFKPVDTRQRRVVNYATKLDELKRIFQSLPNDKKEIVVDSFICEIDSLDLPAEGKKILRDLRAISEKLSQGMEYARIFEEFKRSL